jgi:dTDP-4-dehydrorhamnose 3,5-epimerase-like enzyme
MARKHLVRIDPAALLPPFDVERIYCIWGTAPGVVRGKHAHRDLQQLILCVHGACTVQLEDSDGRETYRLRDPAEGLLVGSYTWRELADFTPDCVLVVLASRRFDADDYIRDYNEFRELLQGPIHVACHH